MSLLGHHRPWQPQDAGPEPTGVLFASGQERAPAWLCTAHTPLPSGWVLSHPGVPQLSPTPLCVSPPHLQQSIGFVFTPNRVFSLPLSLLAQLKSEKYIDLRN